MTIMERFQNLIAKINNCHNENCDDCIDYDTCMVEIIDEAYEVFPRVYTLLVNQTDKINYLTNEIEELMAVISHWEEEYDNEL